MEWLLIRFGFRSIASGHLTALVAALRLHSQADKRLRAFGQFCGLFDPVMGEALHTTLRLYNLPTPHPTTLLTASPHHLTICQHPTGRAEFAFFLSALSETLSSRVGSSIYIPQENTHLLSADRMTAVMSCLLGGAESSSSTVARAQIRSQMRTTESLSLDDFLEIATERFSGTRFVQTRDDFQQVTVVARAAARVQRCK